MSILLENQLHCPTEPLAQFFSSLDAQQRGTISLGDLHRFADRFCVFHNISFVQKKILLLMISTGFSKYTQSSLSFSDLLVYAPRILLILSPHSAGAKECQEGAITRHNILSGSEKHISIQTLSEYIQTHLPSMMPNKKILSLFVAHIIYTICSSHPHCGQAIISKEAWSDTALALFFECTQS